MEKITLALDWTPNPIHSGIFYAFHQQWYKKAGIELVWLDPQKQKFDKMAYQMAQSDEVDLAINPSECVIQSELDFPLQPVKSVAAILQGFPTAFAISTAKKSKTSLQYGAFSLPFEEKIIKRVVSEALPDAQVDFLTLEKENIYAALEIQTIDFTWLFKPIEGVEARLKGLDYTYVGLEDVGIPYGYSPVLIAGPRMYTQRQDVLSLFLSITAQAYEHISSRPEEAAATLLNYSYGPTFAKYSWLLEMQKETAKYYLTETGHWGKMDPKRWENFRNWINAK